MNKGIQAQPELNWLNLLWQPDNCWAVYPFQFGSGGCFPVALNQKRFAGNCYSAS